MARTARLLVFLWICAAAAAVAQDFDANAERQLAALVNQERQKQGQSPLQLEPRLTESARAHARELASHGSLAHQFPDEPALNDRIAQTDLRLDATAENVAYGGSVTGVHEALMNSPGHRANILSPKYNAIGIAAIRVGRRLYVAQNFAHRLPELTIDEAESLIVRALNEARRQVGSPTMTAHSTTTIRQSACTMARRDKLDTSPGISTQMRYVAAYTVTEPSRLPASMIQARNDRSLQDVLVGACFARSRSYPNGIYWVLAVFY